MSSKAPRKPAPKKQGTQKQNATQQNRPVQQAQQSYQQKVAGPAAQSIEAKKEARMQRQEAARIEGARRRRMKNLRRTAIFAAIGVVLLGTAIALYLREVNKPGQFVAEMSDRHHLKTGQTFPGPYNSDPPTSGPHMEAVPQFKIYSEPITKELQVHGLEDGGVVINYKPELDKPTVDKLAALTQSYLERSNSTNHVILSPYPNLSNPIVLTAWSRIDRVDTFDEARIRRFIDEYVAIDHHEGQEGKRLP